MVTVEERIDSLLDSEPSCEQLLLARQLLAEAASEIELLRRQLASK